MTQCLKHRTEDETMDEEPEAAQLMEVAVPDQPVQVIVPDAAPDQLPMQQDDLEVAVQPDINVVLPMVRNL